MRETPKIETAETQDWPAYWLVCLESAVSRGDHAGAARAQEELQRLGYKVEIRLLSKKEFELCA